MKSFDKVQHLVLENDLKTYLTTSVILIILYLLNSYANFNMDDKMGELNADKLVKVGKSKFVLVFTADTQ